MITARKCHFSPGTLPPAILKNMYIVTMNYKSYESDSTISDTRQQKPGKQNTYIGKCPGAKDREEKSYEGNRLMG